jgi:hypothetical protein
VKKRGPDQNYWFSGRENYCFPAISPRGGGNQLCIIKSPSFSTPYQPHFMKTFVSSALAVAALLLGTTAASAQTNALKVNLLSPLFKTGSFFYEHKINDASSVQLGGLVTHWGLGDTKISGFAITPEYRRYLSSEKPAMQGFYVAPFLRYQNLGLSLQTTADDGTEATAKAVLNTIGGGVVVGHQWVFQHRITLDTFFGPSYNSNFTKIKASSNDASASFDVGSFQGFSLRTGITLGVAF